MLSSLGKSSSGTSSVAGARDALVTSSSQMLLIRRVVLAILVCRLICRLIASEVRSMLC